MYTASQIEVSKVPDRDQEYRCILEITLTEIEFDQVKNSPCDY